MVHPSHIPRLQRLYILQCSIDNDFKGKRALLRIGNLRELKNRVKRATLLAQDRLIHKTDLGEFNVINCGEEELPVATPFALHDKNTEKERILQALQNVTSVILKEISRRLSADLLVQTVAIAIRKRSMWSNGPVVI